MACGAGVCPKGGGSKIVLCEALVAPGVDYVRFFGEDRYCGF